MVNPDLRELLKNNKRRYSLVMATAKRARQIVDEANESKEIIIEKPVSIAIDELLSGKLTFTEPEIVDDIFENMEFGKSKDSETPDLSDTLEHEDFEDGSSDNMDEDDTDESGDNDEDNDVEEQE